MAKGMRWTPMSVVALLLIVLVAGVFTGYIPVGKQATIASPEKADQVPVTTCDSTTTPDVNLKAYDKDNVGTAITEAGIYRKVGENTWTAFTPGTAITGLEVNTDYEAVFGISTSDFLDNAYGKFVTFTAPCRETETLSYEMANDEVETSLVATFYNADDNAAAETFSAGETQTVSIKLKAGTDEYFGNPFIAGNNNVLALKLNSSQWDKPEQVYIEGGNELDSIACPQRVLTDNTASSFTIYCFDLPVVNDREVRIKMDLNADDTNAPSVDGTAYMYASGYFINAETGNVEFGVETEEQGAVATDAADSVALDFTA